MTAKQIIINNKYLKNLEKYKEKFFEYIENKDQKSLLIYLRKLHFSDISILIKEINVSDREFVLSSIKDNFIPEILLDFETDLLVEVIDVLGYKNVAQYISKLKIDDAVDIIAHFKEGERQEILFYLSKALALNLERSLSYPEDSVGRMMDSGVYYVPKYFTINEVVEYYRNYKGEISDNINVVVVINHEFEPIGMVQIKNLIKYEFSTVIGDVMELDVQLANVAMDQKEVISRFHKYKLQAIPVVNKDKRLAGIINVDDVMEVVEEQAKEELLHVGGVSESDMHSSILNTVKNRSRWLSVNLFVVLIMAFLMSLFKDVMENYIILAILVPIIASMTANAGIQTSTVLIRVLVDNKVRNIGSLVVKEVLVAFIHGVIFSCIIGLIIFIFTQQIEYSLIFASSIVITMMVAAFFGVLVPYSLDKLGVDLAVSSGILLTTVTDIVSVVSLLGIASLVFLS